LNKRAGTPVHKAFYALMALPAVMAVPAAAGEQGHHAQAEAAHPLDALNSSEIQTVTAVLRRAGSMPDGAEVVSLTVLEPAKEQILDSRRTGLLPRRALAVLRNGRRSYEVTVDISSRRVLSSKAVQGQVSISSSEWALANRLVRADPRWVAAMLKRGIRETDSIYCVALSVGYFGNTAQERRLVKLPCYKTTGATTNLYDRPIEGVIATVDLDDAVVVEVIDSGRAPVSGRIYDLKGSGPHSARVGPMSASGTATPAPKFRKGSRVEWGPWSFHMRTDPRVGPILSLVSFRDGARDRRVLYQAHLSELFVPYMSNDRGWYFRTFMDVGEYGVGAVSRLEPGIDCPSDADFMTITLADAKGAPTVLENSSCLFERPTAMPAWRHRESLTKQFAGSAGTELVLRSAPTLANYDYFIDWIFASTGEIRVEVGATGVMAVKGVQAHQAAGADLPDGALVAPHLVGVHHDHLFAFRFDLDVDGSENDFVVDRLTAGPPSSSTPRGSVWRVESETMGQEGSFNREGASRWRFMNPLARTGLGYNPSYEIVPGETATSLLSKDDWPQRRAAFSGSTLWVTRYNPEELFAAGAYPNQSRGDLGLTAYNDKAPIKGADLVAWYTMGFHHITRPEDWPIVSTMRRSVTLRPVAFFETNPATAEPVKH
jgi:primary-amine oxidase